MIYAALSCFFLPYIFLTRDAFVLKIILWLIILFPITLLPLFFAINYAYKIIVTDSDLIIYYKHFNTDKTIRLNKKEAKIFFYQPSKGATPYHFTFGQKVHGYNNKVFLTQYLFADWNNKEKNDYPHLT